MFFINNILNVATFGKVDCEIFMSLIIILCQLIGPKRREEEKNEAKCTIT